MSYEAFVVNREGDFLAIACDEECAQYIVDELMKQPEAKPGAYGYIERRFPVVKQCLACGDEIHAQIPRE